MGAGELNIQKSAGAAADSAATMQAAAVTPGVCLLLADRTQWHSCWRGGTR
jgi:hypothetical protein